MPGCPKDMNIYHNILIFERNSIKNERSQFNSFISPSQMFSGRDGQYTSIVLYLIA